MVESEPAPGHAPAPTGPVRLRPVRPLARTRARRALYSLLAVGVVLAIGTLGFHWIANVGFIDAFYFESMLATGQGPPFPLTSDTAKLFASVMAFVSIGSVLTSVVFTLGPIASKLWHEAAERVEQEVRIVGEELDGHVRSHERPGRRV